MNFSNKVVGTSLRIQYKKREPTETKWKYLQSNPLETSFVFETYSNLKCQSFENNRRS